MKSKKFLKKKTERGVCTLNRIVYGMVTVSDKGQIAIPIDIRRDLNIKSGNRLLVLKRKDEKGITLLKVDVMNQLLTKIQEEDSFFKTQKR